MNTPRTYRATADAREYFGEVDEIVTSAGLAHLALDLGAAFDPDGGPLVLEVLSGSIVWDNNEGETVVLYREVGDE